VLVQRERHVRRDASEQLAQHAVVQHLRDARAGRRFELGPRGCGCAWRCCGWR